MPYISVRLDQVGIGSLMATKPATGAKLTALTEQLLRGPSPLSPGERELIAAHVSYRNDCRFCTYAHSAAARHALGDDGSLIFAVRSDPATAPISEKLRALLALAAKVQVSGTAVTADDIARARAAGAGDEELHDTVLIAAAYSMFNRYVDGLAAVTPPDERDYDEVGRRFATEGYLRTEL